MNRHRVALALVAVAVTALAFPAIAAAADPQLAPVFSEEFGSAPTALASTFSSSGVWGPTRGTGITSNGAITLRPLAARGASALYTSAPAISALPARVTFRVRYPQGTYRVAKVQLYGAAPYTAAGTPSGASKLVDWNLGSTAYSTLAWPLQLRASYLGRLDGPYRDPSPVIPGDQWLQGELYISSDTLTGTFNGQALTARHDFASQVGKGLYLALAATDDQKPAGVEFDYVRVEQAAAAAPNLAPIAAMSAPSEKFTGQAFAFDGTASSDPDGYIVSCAWDFGDGSGATGPSASHAYSRPGAYRVTLTVTDDDGASASTGATVTVRSAAPTAAISAPADTPVRQPVAFDGSASADPDGVIADYAWDFGDGTSGSGATAVHAFASPGTYAVRLTVTDDAGLSASTSVQVIVHAVPPVARIVAPASQLVLLSSSFDGSASSDPDGSIVSYEWDFGDGGSASGMQVAHAYSEPGTYTVTLTVTDDDGASAATTAAIAVEPPSAGIERLIAQVDASPLNYGQKQKLLVELRAALVASQDGNRLSTALELRKFISKLVPDKKVDEGAKAAWTSQALAVMRSMAIEAISKSGKGTPGPRHTRID